jgi:hypothetical protein
MGLQDQIGREKDLHAKKPARCPKQRTRFARGLPCLWMIRGCSCPPAARRMVNIDQFPDHYASRQSLIANLDWNRKQVFIQRPIVRAPSRTGADV